MLEEKNVFRRMSEEADIITADTRCQLAGFNHSRFFVTTVTTIPGSHDLGTVKRNTYDPKIQHLIIWIKR